jgi:hypothetical protein
MYELAAEAARISAFRQISRTGAFERIFAAQFLRFLLMGPL